ncbi:aldehyde dehydrogenase domain-containing protein [Plectosphaerella plurivora]|uniref:Aldehyde dehydrogenase domain-containing protein n=1 Tax=Plectosphaerella plurivora TaxID=936078 RepID=A0A9P8V0D4_9PEZI|nr:aldehyde dehydrogenase domain-containing protein [Plectosphaerella plurivora]
MIVTSPPLSTQLTAPNGHTFTQPLGLWIGNEWVAAKSGKTIEVGSPITEETITSIHAANEDDIDLAVRTAYDTFRRGPWPKMTPTERGVLLLRLADLAEKDIEVLSVIDTWNNGKALSGAREDVEDLVAVLRYYGGFADKITGKSYTPNGNKIAYSIREPLGVCGQIIPWNYPLGMLSWKIAPAVAAGNTVVIKPAEQTPLSALYFADLVKKAGFPPGVINIVNGFGRDAGVALVTHPLVRKVAFTGSTATGREIMKLAAGTLKNITLETGGKSPALIFPDAELDNAVAWCHYGIMANQGQICTATSRILVHEAIYEDFIKAFLDRVKQVSKVGDPFAEDTYQGPQVTQQQYRSVLSLIEKGKAEGATILAGGNPHKGLNGKGYYIEPTVFADVKDHMTIWKEEIFGPCVAIDKFSTDDEAITRANDTAYGLGAAVFTQDITKANVLAKQIESGTVWINSSQDTHTSIPFGGFKQSGIGAELAEEGIAAYTANKVIHINLGSRL